MDTLLLHLSDFFDRDQTGDVEVPNIRMCNYEFQWQVQPTEMNYAAMRDAVTSYLSVFQPHGQIMEQTTEHSGAPNHPQEMTM